MADKWISDTDDNISQVLKEIKERLQIQYKILFSKSKKAADIEKAIESTFNSKEQELFKQLALAWYYFYIRDWQKLDSLISRIVPKTLFESEYFLAIQGFINMTRLQRHIVNKPDQEYSESSGYR